MKKILLLVGVLASVSFVFAAETAKPATADKAKVGAKADAKCDDGSCCDDDAKPADAKTAKADPKADSAKKDTDKPIAKT